jgi:hypothetical protein
MELIVENKASKDIDQLDGINLFSLLAYKCKAIIKNNNTKQYKAKLVKAMLK